MEYFVTKYGIIIDENNTIIPQDESSELYQDYLTYLQNNGTLYITDYLTELDLDLQHKELVPNSVTKRQLKQALVLN